MFLRERQRCGVGLIHNGRGEWERDEVGMSNFSQIACRAVMFPEEEGLCVTSRNYT